jgi:hypothetical protein
LVLQPAQLALKVLGVWLVGQQFELHELEAGLNVGTDLHIFVVDVADAERICGVSRGKFVDVESFEVSLRLSVEDRIPPSLEHVADLQLILARWEGTDVNRILLLGLWVASLLLKISKKHCFSYDFSFRLNLVEATNTRRRISPRIFLDI